MNALFTFTRINPYLDLLPGIGYQHSIALWKAYNKRKQKAQFLQRNFLTDAFKGELATFYFFLNKHLGFKTFANILAYFNLLDQGLFKNCIISIIFREFLFGTLFA